MIKKILLRLFISFFPVHRLLNIIRLVTEKEQRINIYKDEIKLDTNKEEGIRLHLDEIRELIEPEERFLFPSFEKGYGPEIDRFFYQKEYVDFNIKNGENILDIGSGGYPFPFATHLADLYEGETTHRAEPIVKDARPFQICNIEILPYEDKEFDFVYCSHILEHVQNPSIACEEIMRVGKRGYIETPTRMSDIMLNFTGIKDHHKWYINMTENSLFFFEWRDEDRRDTGCNDFFKMLHSKYKNPFQTLMNTNRNMFVNMLLWEGKFYYYVFDKSGKLMATNKNDG